MGEAADPIESLRAKVDASAERQDRPMFLALLNALAAAIWIGIYADEGHAAFLAIGAFMALTAIVVALAASGRRP